MAFVEFREVTKYYQMGEQKIPAADGITFSFEKGEFVIIVGPSGAGKTTVLNMLGGMDVCSGGEIRLEDKLVSSYSSRQLTEYRRYDIGFVFQFYNLVPNLTALENVELACQICRDPLDPAETLKMVGLEDRMDNFPAQLSGGGAAESVHRQGDLQKSEATSVRRTHRCVGLQYWADDIKATTGYLSEYGPDRGGHNPQSGVYCVGQPGHYN